MIATPRRSVVRKSEIVRTVAASTGAAIVTADGLAHRPTPAPDEFVEAAVDGVAERVGSTGPRFLDSWIVVRS